MEKLTVITDANGQVVATSPGHGRQERPDSGLQVWISAGPGQTLHEIEYELPRLRKTADVEAFHKALTEHIRKR